MKAEVNASFLNCLKHEGKEKGKEYYTLSFLDNDDNSYNCFISKDLYEIINSAVNDKRVKRFYPIIITLNIYKGKDGHYNFSPTDITVVPFEDEHKLADKHEGNTADSKNKK